MLADIGQYTLVLSLIISVLLTFIPIYGYFSNNQMLMQMARPLAYVLFLCLATSFVILIVLFVIQDFSVTYVWRNSNSILPIRYRISATWGAHEGSILMWITIQAMWIMAVARYSRSLSNDQIARVLSVLGAVILGFTAFVLFTSNPFERTFPVPIDGVDLNPLLQDIGLIIHPPLLYMGYVGLSVAFALSIAALIGGKIDENWIRWSRKWTNIAWGFLTAGIILGSWWAYYELGWGGWWFWDPVENASFLPWLAATALIHVQAVSERKNAFRGWTVLLAIIAFNLSVLGTFLVRSGVLTSVHSFAADPTRGLFILVLLGIYAGGGLFLYALRAQSLKSEKSINFDSKETLLLVNSLIFIVATFTILIGTLFPLIFDALGKKISVGAPYFSLMFFVIMTPMAILMPLGVWMKWQNGDIRRAIKILMPIFVISMVLSVLIWYWQAPLDIRAIAGIMGAMWILSSSIWSIKSRINSINASFVGMSVAHIGVAIFVFGVSMTEYTDTEKDIMMTPGQTETIAGFEIQFTGVKPVQYENYQAQEGEFIISSQGKVFAQLYPQKRVYPRQESPMTEAGIYPGFTKDIYVSLGNQINQQGAWSVRIYIKPFIRWMWGGGLLMMLGAFIAIMDKRFKRKESQQLDRLYQSTLELK